MGSKSEIYVYRVLLKSEWNEFKKKKKFFGNELDMRSGFIHLSTKAQLSDTIQKYYNKHKEIIILKLNVKDLKKKLKWEVSRDKQLFPHLYGFIDYFNVKQTEQKL